MHAATAISTTPATPVFHSAMSLAPGRPRPLARRLAIHNRAMHSIRKFMDDQKFNEVPVSYPWASDTRTDLSSQQTGYQFLQGMIAQGFPAVWCEGEQNSSETSEKTTAGQFTGFKLVQGSMTNASLSDLADLMENLIKTVAASLGADLLGGRHIIRLDRMLSINHPRLTYDQALEIVNRRGFNLKPGETIPSEAMATLTRYVNNLPFILTNQPGTTKNFSYVFPFAGLLGHGAPGKAGSVNFTLEVAPLLQYIMGLSSITDAVIHPLGPVSNQLSGTLHGRD